MKRIIASLILGLAVIGVGAGVMIHNQTVRADHALAVASAAQHKADDAKKVSDKLAADKAVADQEAHDKAIADAATATQAAKDKATADAKAKAQATADAKVKAQAVADAKAKAQASTLTQCQKMRNDGLPYLTAYSAWINAGSPASWDVDNDGYPCEQAYGDMN